MILDEGFDNIRKLNIDEQHREMLSVNEPAWEQAVHDYDRKYILGCAAFVVWLPLIAFAVPSFPLKPYIFLGIFLMSILLKGFNIRQCKYLIPHGKFEYEFAYDRVVRYGASKYYILAYTDIALVMEKSYGIILIKNKHWLQRLKLKLWRAESEDYIIIPKQIQSYEQVKAFLWKALK